MLEQFCDEFLATAPLQLPELLDKRRMEAPEYYDDYALLTFALAAPRSMEDVMDMLEDEMEMIILYHHIPSRHTEFGHSCCAFSNPKFGRMFKINASTNGSGMVDTLTVTVYCSLEYMEADLCVDLKLHDSTGHFKYKMPKEKMLITFF